MMSVRKRTRFLALGIAIAAALAFVGWRASTMFDRGPEVVFEFPSRASSSASSAAAASLPNAQSSSSLPRSVLIEVPFASQAPFGNWDMPYQEACEEASLILVHHYLTGTPLSNDIMDKEILTLVAWEDAQVIPVDIGVDDVATLAEEYFGYDSLVIEEVTEERLKRELAAGHPIIVPAAGQMLGNPYFSGDGPPYHMLVVIGYDGDQFITNDVGTRRGAKFRYDADVLLDAIHDWTGKKEYANQGRKVMLRLTPKAAQ